MNGRQFLELLARLPARVWLQAILGPSSLASDRVSPRMPAFAVA